MQKNIVVVGGGFAGINLAKDLAKDPNFKITLVDKNNYNFFPPLIYQVATAFLEPSSISYPFRKLFADKKNLYFRLGSLMKVVPEKNTIILNNGEIQYDYLVFAVGAETNFFGNENIKKHAITMKTLSDALSMRNTLLKRMEQASISTDPEESKSLLTMVIAGGGPTGVEISGMFAEMKKGILVKDYPELRHATGEVYLVDGGSSVLSHMSEQSQRGTTADLEKLGVKQVMSTRVNDFDGEVVTLSDGMKIASKNLIWAAGITCRTFEGVPIEWYGKGHRLLVDEHNLVVGSTNVYAIGDNCLQHHESEYPNGHPQVAQAAIQQGKLLAKNFKRMAANKPLSAFKYHDKGSMAIIGSAKAVVDLPKPELHMKGFIAWLVWLFIHLMSLITYRNRARTFWNWMIAYLSRDQSLRMIIKTTDKDDIL